MKRILRSFLTLLMLVVWASGFAQSSLSVDFESDLTTYTDWTFKNIAQSATVTPHTGTHYGNTSGKTIAYVQTKNKIEAPQQLTFYISKESNNSKTSNWKIQVSTDGKTWTDVNKVNASSMKKGEWTEVTQNLEKYKNNYVRVFYQGNTAVRCIDDITLTVAATKTATTLTFTNSTINIEEGNEANFAAQTATLKTGETVLNKVVTYTTNNDAMFEAYEANVGPKALKVGAYGTAVVTAKFAGDDTYAASTATYTVNYTEKVKPATTLDFGFATKSVNINESFTAPATLKAGEAAISGAVTYTSSKTEVATVDKTTGEVSALTAGTTTITATFADTNEYKGSTASYELTVVDPNALEVTFDFSKPDVYGYTLPDIGSATNLEEGDKIQSGVITITNIKSGKTGPNTNKARFHNKKNEGITFRVYANGEITLSAQAGYTITKFVFESSQGGSLTVSPGTYDSKTKTWEGNAQTITLTIPNGQQATFFQTMTVNYSKSAANPTLTLDEKAEDTGDVLLKTESGKAYDVKLARTLTANVWNTICLPFDVTAEQIADVLKSAGNVKEYDREDATKQTIYFKDATTMVAGKPYLIKPTESAKELVFKGVKITEYEPNKKVGGDNYAVYGTFGKYTMKTDGTELFLKTDGKFYIPAASTATMKGFRAYFYNINGSTAAAALNLSFGDATGINGVAADAEKNVKVRADASN